MLGVGKVITQEDTMINVYHREERTPSLHFLKYLLWDSKKEVPCFFQLSYDDSVLLIQMTAKESVPLTRYTSDQDPVYRDSAMEFFIRFREKSYFNFEFNRSGAVLAQYGLKEQREYLSKEWMQRIERIIHITSSTWSVELRIPWDLFLAYENDMEMMGEEFYFNAYKISEEAHQQHFQSYFEVVSDKPDFHLPEYFGKAVLQKKEPEPREY